MLQCGPARGTREPPPLLLVPCAMGLIDGSTGFFRQNPIGFDDEHIMYFLDSSNMASWRITELNGGVQLEKYGKITDFYGPFSSKSCLIAGGYSNRNSMRLIRVQKLQIFDPNMCL